MSRPGDNIRTIKGTSLGATAKAVKFRVTHVSDEPLIKIVEEWFPFSMIVRSFKDPNKSGEDTLSVKEWILDQKGLMDPKKYEGVTSSYPKDVPLADHRERDLPRASSGFDDYDDIDDDIPF